MSGDGHAGSGKDAHKNLDSHGAKKKDSAHSGKSSHGDGKGSHSTSGHDAKAGHAGGKGDAKSGHTTSGHSLESHSHSKSTHATDKNHAGHSTSKTEAGGLFGVLKRRVEAKVESLSKELHHDLEKAEKKLAPANLFAPKTLMKRDHKDEQHPHETKTATKLDITSFINKARTTVQNELHTDMQKLKSLEKTVVHGAEKLVHKAQELIRVDGPPGQTAAERAQAKVSHYEDPKTHVKYDYDKHGREVRTHYPDGKSTRTEYKGEQSEPAKYVQIDAKQRVTDVVTDKGHHTHLEYDAHSDSKAPTSFSIVNSHTGKSEWAGYAAPNSKIEFDTHTGNIKVRTEVKDDQHTRQLEDEFSADGARTTVVSENGHRLSKQKFRPGLNEAKPKLEESTVYTYYTPDGNVADAKNFSPDTKCMAVQTDALGRITHRLDFDSVEKADHWQPSRRTDITYKVESNPKTHHDENVVTRVVHDLSHGDEIAMKREDRVDPITTNSTSKSEFYQNGKVIQVERAEKTINPLTHETAVHTSVEQNGHVVQDRNALFSSEGKAISLTSKEGDHKYEYKFDENGKVLLNNGHPEITVDGKKVDLDKLPDKERQRLEANMLSRAGEANLFMTNTIAQNDVKVYDPREHMQEIGPTNPPPVRHGAEATGTLVCYYGSENKLSQLRVDKGTVKDSTGNIVGSMNDDGTVKLKNGTSFNILDASSEGAAFHGIGSDKQRLDLVDKKDLEKSNYNGVLSSQDGVNRTVIGNNIYDQHGDFLAHMNADGTVQKLGTTRGQVTDMCSEFRDCSFEGFDRGNVRRFKADAQASNGHMFIQDANHKPVKYDVVLGMIIRAPWTDEKGVEHPGGEQLGNLQLTSANSKLEGGTIVHGNPPQSTALENFNGAVLDVHMAGRGDDGGPGHERERNIQVVCRGAQERDANGNIIGGGSPFFDLAGKIDSEQQHYKEERTAFEEKVEATGHGLSLLGNTAVRVETLGMLNPNQKIIDLYTSEFGKVQDETNAQLAAARHILATGKIDDESGKIGLTTSKFQSEQLTDPILAMRKQLDTMPNRLEQLPKSESKVATIKGYVMVPTEGGKTTKVAIENGHFMSPDGKTAVGQLHGGEGNMTFMDPTTHRLQEMHMRDLRGAVWHLEYTNEANQTQKVDWVGLGSDRGMISVDDYKRRAHEEVTLANSLNDGYHSEKTQAHLKEARENAQAFNARLDNITKNGITNPKDLDFLGAGPKENVRAKETQALEKAEQPQKVHVEKPPLTSKNVSTVDGQVRIGNDCFKSIKGQLHKITGPSANDYAKDATAQLGPGYTVYFNNGRTVDLTKEPRVLMQFTVEGSNTEHRLVGLGVGRITNNGEHFEGGLVEADQLLKQAQTDRQKAHDGDFEYFKSRSTLMGETWNIGMGRRAEILQNLEHNIGQDELNLHKELNRAFSEGFDPNKFDNNKLDGYTRVTQRLMTDIGATSGDSNRLAQEGVKLQSQANEAAVMAVMTVSTAGVGTMFNALGTGVKGLIAAKYTQNAVQMTRLAQVTMYGAEVTIDATAGGVISQGMRSTDSSTEAEKNRLFWSGTFEGGAMGVGSVGGKIFQPLMEGTHAVDALKVSGYSSRTANLYVNTARVAWKSVDALAQTSAFSLSNHMRQMEEADANLQGLAAVRTAWSKVSNEELAVGTLAMGVGQFAHTKIGKGTEQLFGKESFATRAIGDMTMGYTNSAVSAIPEAFKEQTTAIAAKYGLKPEDVTVQMLLANGNFNVTQAASFINQSGLEGSASAGLIAVSSHHVMKAFERQLSGGRQPEVHKGLFGDVEKVHMADGATPLGERTFKYGTVDNQKFVSEMTVTGPDASSAKTRYTSSDGATYKIEHLDHNGRVLSTDEFQGSVSIGKLNRGSESIDGAVTISDATGKRHELPDGTTIHESPDAKGQEVWSRHGEVIKISTPPHGKEDSHTFGPNSIETPHGHLLKMEKGPLAGKWTEEVNGKRQEVPISRVQELLAQSIGVEPESFKPLFPGGPREAIALDGMIARLSLDGHVEMFTGRAELERVKMQRELDGLKHNARQLEQLARKGKLSPEDEAHLERTRQAIEEFRTERRLATVPTAEQRIAHAESNEGVRPDTQEKRPLASGKSEDSIANENSQVETKDAAAAHEHEQVGGKAEENREAVVHEQSRTTNSEETSQRATSDVLTAEHKRVTEVVAEHLPEDLAERINRATAKFNEELQSMPGDALEANSEKAARILRQAADSLEGIVPEGMRFKHSENSASEDLKGTVGLVKDGSKWTEGQKDFAETRVREIERFLEHASLDIQGKAARDNDREALAHDKFNEAVRTVCADNPTMQARLSSAMEAFRERLYMDPHIDRQELARTMDHVSALLKDVPGAATSLEERRHLALELLTQLAFPTSIDQGTHPTCNVTTEQVRLTMREPSEVARIIRELALTGECKTADGSVIKAEHPGDAVGLAMDKDAIRKREQDNSMPSERDLGNRRDGGYRSHCSQLIQKFLVNVKWELETQTHLGIKVPAGTYHYDGVHVYDTRTNTVIARDANNNPDKTPNLVASDMQTIYQRLTGKKESFIMLNTESYYHDANNIAAHYRYTDTASMYEVLRNIKAERNFPTILALHTFHEPFWSDAAYAAGGEHVVGVHGYEIVIDPLDKRPVAEQLLRPKPENVLVSVDNQWGKDGDHVIHKIPLDQLCRATREVFDIRNVRDLEAQVAAHPKDLRLQLDLARYKHEVYKKREEWLAKLKDPNCDNYDKEDAEAYLRNLTGKDALSAKELQAEARRINAAATSPWSERLKEWGHAQIDRFRKADGTAHIGDFTLSGGGQPLALRERAKTREMAEVLQSQAREEQLEHAYREQSKLVGAGRDSDSGTEFNKGKKFEYKEQAITNKDFTLRRGEINEPLHVVRANGTRAEARAVDGKEIYEVGPGKQLIRHTADGSIEYHELVKGHERVTPVWADLAREITLIDNSMARFNANDIPPFEKNFNHFVRRAKADGLQDHEIAVSLQQIRQLIEFKGEAAVADPQERLRLARQAMYQAAHPESCDQGYNNTCPLLVCENLIYRTSPAQAIQLIKEVATTGKYICADGSVVDMASIRGALTPDAEASLPGLATNRKRTFASQIFQMTTANIHWSRAFEGEYGKRVERAYNNDIHKELLDNANKKRAAEGKPPVSDIEVRYELVKPRDGERLGVYEMINGKPGARLDELKDSRGKAMDNPAISGSFIQELFNQITGREATGHMLAYVPPGDGSHQMAETRKWENIQGFSSAQQLNDVLVRSTPVAITVNNSHHPFHADSRTFGNHWVVIRDYDPVTRTLSIENQYGDNKYRRISLDTLFDATQGTIKLSTQFKRWVNIIRHGNTEYIRERSVTPESIELKIAQSGHPGSANGEDTIRTVRGRKPDPVHSQEPDGPAVDYLGEHRRRQAGEKFPNSSKHKDSDESHVKPGRVEKDIQPPASPAAEKPARSRAAIEAESRQAEEAMKRHVIEKYLKSEKYELPANLSRKEYQELNKQLEKEHALLDHLARTDGMTGLLNRKGLTDVLEQELQVFETRKKGKIAAPAVVFMDFDKFKPVNDTFGHMRGDDLIVFFGKWLKENFRNTDVPSRFGGDEFVAVIRNAKDLEVLKQKLASLQIAVAREGEPRVLKPNENPLPGELVVGISSGIARFEPKGGSEPYEDKAKELLHAADQAMYVDKKQRTGKEQLEAKPKPDVKIEVDPQLETEQRRQRSITKRLGPALEYVAPTQTINEMREVIVRNHARNMEIVRNLIRDPLTGLINKTEAEARLERCVNDCNRASVEATKNGGDQPKLTVLSIDVDGLKKVNDMFGHAAGDQLLRELTAFMTKEGFRDSDTLARLGGDEYLALMPDCKDCSRTVAALRTKMVACYVDETGFFRMRPITAEEKVGPNEVRSGISVGIADWQPGRTAAEMKEVSDTSLYADKADREKRGLRSPRDAKPETTDQSGDAATEKANTKNQIPSLNKNQFAHDDGEGSGDHLRDSSSHHDDAHTSENPLDGLTSIFANLSRQEGDYDEERIDIKGHSIHAFLDQEEPAQAQAQAQERLTREEQERKRQAAWDERIKNFVENEQIPPDVRSRVERMKLEEQVRFLNQRPEKVNWEAYFDEHAKREAIRIHRIFPALAKDGGEAQRRSDVRFPGYWSFPDLGNLPDGGLRNLLKHRLADFKNHPFNSVDNMENFHTLLASVPRTWDQETSHRMQVLSGELAPLEKQEAKWKDDLKALTEAVDKNSTPEVASERDNLKKMYDELQSRIKPLREELNPHLQTRLQQLQNQIDAFTESLGMPSVKVVAADIPDTATAVYSLAEGKIGLREGALCDAKLVDVGVLYHELLHSEQDAVVMRNALLEAWRNSDKSIPLEKFMSDSRLVVEEVYNQPMSKFVNEKLHIEKDHYENVFPPEQNRELLEEYKRINSSLPADAAERAVAISNMGDSEREHFSLLERTAAKQNLHDRQIAWLSERANLSPEDLEKDPAYLRAKHLGDSIKERPIQHDAQGKVIEPPKKPEVLQVELLQRLQKSVPQNHLEAGELERLLQDPSALRKMLDSSIANHLKPHEFVSLLESEEFQQRIFGYKLLDPIYGRNENGNASDVRYHRDEAFENLLETKKGFAASVLRYNVDQWSKALPEGEEPSTNKTKIRMMVKALIHEFVENVQNGKAVDTPEFEQAVKKILKEAEIDARNNAARRIWKDYLSNNFEFEANLAGDRLNKLFAQTGVESHSQPAVETGLRSAADVAPSGPVFYSLRRNQAGEYLETASGEKRVVDANSTHWDFDRRSNQWQASDGRVLDSTPMHETKVLPNGRIEVAPDYSRHTFLQDRISSMQDSDGNTFHFQYSQGDKQLARIDFPDGKVAFKDASGAWIEMYPAGHARAAESAMRYAHREYKLENGALHQLDAYQKLTYLADGSVITRVGDGLIQEIGKPSGPFREQIERSLLELPAPIRDFLVRRGHVTVLSRTMMDSCPDIAFERLRGWPPGTDGRFCAGIFDPQRSTAVLNELVMHTDRVWRGSLEREHVIKHETGHSFDYAMGHVSQRTEFLDLYSADRAALPVEQHANLSYFLQEKRAGAEEVFAEMFAVLLEKSPTTNADLPSLFPRVRDYVQEQINRVQRIEGEEPASDHMQSLTPRTIESAASSEVQVKQFARLMKARHHGADTIAPSMPLSDLKDADFASLLKDARIPTLNSLTYLAKQYEGMRTSTDPDEQQALKARFDRNLKTTLSMLDEMSDTSNFSPEAAARQRYARQLREASAPLLLKLVRDGLVDTKTFETLKTDPLDVKVEKAKKRMDILENDVCPRLEALSTIPIKTVLQATTLIDFDEEVNKQISIFRTEFQLLSDKQRQKPLSPLVADLHETMGDFLTNRASDRMIHRYGWNETNRGAFDKNDIQMNDGFGAQRRVFSAIAQLLEEGRLDTPQIKDRLEKSSLESENLIGIGMKNKSPADGVGADYLLMDYTTGDYYPIDLTIKTDASYNHDKLVESQSTNPRLTWSSEKNVPAERQRWLLCTSDDTNWENQVKAHMKAEGVPMSEWRNQFVRYDTKETFAKLRDALVEQIVAFAQKGGLNMFSLPLPSNNPDLPVSRKLYEMWQFKRQLQKNGMHEWADAVGSAMYYLRKNQCSPEEQKMWADPVFR